MSSVLKRSINSSYRGFCDKFPTRITASGWLVVLCVHDVGHCKYLQISSPVPLLFACKTWVVGGLKPTTLTLFAAAAGRSGVAGPEEPRYEPSRRLRARPQPERQSSAHQRRGEGIKYRYTRPQMPLFCIDAGFSETQSGFRNGE